MRCVYWARESVFIFYLNSSVVFIPDSQCFFGHLRNERRTTSRFYLVLDYCTCVYGCEDSRGVAQTVQYHTVTARYNQISGTSQ